MHVGMKYSILYSHAGFHSNLQSYIVGMKATPVYETIVGPASGNVTVNYSVTFNHIFTDADETKPTEYKRFDFPP
jgi:hypothetical protein